MKFKIVKIFAFLLICAAAVGVLWRQTHQPYQAVYEKPTESDTVTKSEDEKQVEFPIKVEKKVSNGFFYNAEIIVGENFDADNFYQCTAVLKNLDPQKWMDFFQVNDESWEISEIEDGNTRDGMWRTQINCSSENEDILHIGWDHVLYSVDKMRHINPVFYRDDYLPPTDEMFSKESDLLFENREDNLKFVTEYLSGLDILIDDSMIVSEYSLDTDTLQKHEELRFQEGYMREDERNSSWSSEDEGYYYFFIQAYQGLPVFRFETTISWNKYDDGKISSLELYCTEAGICLIDLSYWFDFKKSDQKIALAPFETIMETIDKKYGNIQTNDKMEVTECRLMLYPKNVGKDELEVIPIWLCTIESDNPYFRTIYLSINAVTGEEVYEMEYYT